jgi:hypothetical protein
MKLGRSISLLGFIFLFSFLQTKAQNGSNIYFTSSVGMFRPVSNFANAYKNSLTLTSGVELQLKKKYFLQFSLDFNSVKYNQLIKENGSNYLFQNTNSSILLAGIGVGKNIYFIKSNKIFISPYLSVGYANIGEPRLEVNNFTNIIDQSVTRMGGAFIRQGVRIAIKTKSKFLQTVYTDFSYWASTITIQDSRSQALSILVGSKIRF